MDDLNDLIANAENTIIAIRRACQELEQSVEAAEALLAKWADEEGRLAGREG